MDVMNSEPFRLTALMRVIGALVVVAAMCAHLLEGWGEWNDVGRYYAMLLSTVGLAVGAFACNTWLKDDKGGRVFVGLALLSVVANVTTLGGLLHSQVQWDGAQPSASVFADWSLSQGASLLAVMSSALVVLLPVIAFAFRVLARTYARELGVFFSFLCALILIPLRESFGVGIVILAATLLPMAYVLRRGWRDACFITLEGRFVQAVLFAPALIMFARLQWLYEADVVLYWMLCFTAYVGCRAGARLVRDPLQWLLWIPAMLLAVSIASLSANLMESTIQSVFLMPLFGLVLGVLVGDLGRDRRQLTFVALGALLAVSLSTLNDVFHSGWLASGAALGMGVLVMLIGFRCGHRSTKLIGLVGVLLAIVPRLWSLIQEVDFGDWLTLLVLGVGIIMASTAVERLVKHKRRVSGRDDVANLVADK